MADVILLTDIRGKMHVFERPLWYVVKVTSTPHGTCVDLSDGAGITRVQISDAHEDFWSNL